MASHAIPFALLFSYLDPSLVSRLADGRTTGRYKEVDYEKLKAITKLKNAAGQQSLEKIKSIHHLSKEKKELNVLQQHKTCWKKELIRLNSLYKSKLYELDMARAGFPWEQSTVKDFFIEVEEYEDFMNEDLLTFSKNTVKPVWDLKEDISAWLQEYKGDNIKYFLLQYSFIHLYPVYINHRSATAV